MKLTVRKKLIFGFSALIILMIILGGVGIYSLSVINNELTVLYDMHLKGIEYIKDAQINLASLGEDRGMLILAVDSKGRETAAKSMKSTFEEFEKNLEDFKSTIVDEEGRSIYSEITKLWEILKPNEESAIALATSGKIEEANQQTMVNRLNSEQIEIKINYLVKQKSELAEAANNGSDMLYSETLVILIIIIVLSVLTGIIVSLYISNIISKPITVMAGATKKIAEGDITVQAIKVKNKDEIGELANSFNIMTDRLRDMIIKITEASQSVAAYSQELSASSEETTAAAEQVSKTILELSSGAAAQSEELEATSSHIGQISSAIQQAAANTESVTNASKNASDAANEGVREAENAVRKIDRVKQVSIESANVVNALGKKSEEIGQIVDVIKNIADQTNLLALNAAIEAARAGEQGRGFAVVAEEVRNLAEQSSASTQKIEGLIKDIQSETNRAVNVIESGGQEILEGVEAVNKAGNTFKSIVKEVENVAEQINEVSAATQQIASESNEIVKSIDSIAAISQQTAASGQEVSAASEEQTASMEEVASSAQELAHLAEELLETVSRFKH
ncbi:methyl-accepting chemotaxis protein [Proteiniborus sp. MB09-C3]|uniref:methyl-accepting chemotaxis protein n=1 Tax=Proteiniborus sp. MB09-C3 TaxID=3050072 RepID=UPI002555CBA7|nr:methyl-accepting chemotaxis protein [Proteiniborus sp. MB09-C3]WIV13335.1 methyl-accepting chemotaxis protein [Proteiniborus sp. MB09-C3]